MLGRIIILLFFGVYLFPCHGEEIRCPDYVQTTKSTDVSVTKLICYANQVTKLSLNECSHEINKLESKPSQQRSFNEKLKLVLLLSHSDLSMRDNRRALDVLATVDSKNFYESQFVEFLSNSLEVRINRCEQTQCDGAIQNEQQSYDSLLREQGQLKSKLDKERKQRKQLQEQLDALMELEETINERETLDSNLQ